MYSSLGFHVISRFRRVSIVPPPQFVKFHYVAQLIMGEIYTSEVASNQKLVL
jgi:hypothetical protein